MGVPVTHILTLSGRSLQSQPFHRESFYVTGTPPRHTSLASVVLSVHSIHSCRRRGVRRDEGRVVWSEKNEEREE